MDRHHGYKGRFKVADAVVASLTAWTLNMTPERANVRCFGDAHNKYVQGPPDMQGTFEGCLDFDPSSPAEGNAGLFASAFAGSQVDIDLIPNNDKPTQMWSGPGVLGISSVNVPATGAATFSGTWAAAASDTDWALAGV